MKKLFVAVALFVFSLNISNAEDTKKIKTLFETDQIEHSAFGEFTPKVTSFDGKASLLLGGGGAWLVNKTFYLGLAGYGLVPGPEKTFTMKNDNNVDTVVDGRVYMGYGGIIIGYNHNPTEIVHMSYSVLFGAGGLSAQDKNDWSNDHDNDNDNSSSRNPWAAFYVIEPTVKVEANVTDFFKIGLSAGYRFAEKFNNSDMFDKNQNLKDMKLSGFTAGLHFMLGGF